MIRATSLRWSSLAAAGLILLVAACLFAALGPQVPPDLETYVLERSAPFVTMLSPPGPLPPALGGAALPTSALAAAGWVALCLSLPPLLMRPLLGRPSALLALPGLAFGLLAALAFLRPAAGGGLAALLPQLFAVNLLVIAVAAGIALLALPVRGLRRR